MDNDDLRDLLETVLDSELDWDERADAFRDAVAGCQKPVEEDDEEDKEAMPRSGKGPGLAVILGVGKEKKRR